MTPNITGIVVEEPDDPLPARKANPIDQFWMAAGDVLIEMVKRQPHIQQAINPVIAGGGDIEITAHNCSPAELTRKQTPKTTSQWPAPEAAPKRKAT